MKLEPTGERMIMEHYKSSPEDFVIYLLHIATYDFAEKYTRGKSVLDYGCGSGYGSARIAQTAASVIAVDVAPDAVEYANERFREENLSFRTIDPTQPLPFADNSFDTILSFQVFEHVADTGLYLSEVKRVLRPGGHFVLVTPDRSTRLLPRQRPWNRWHLHEYGKSELLDLVSPLFPATEIMGMSAKPEMIGIEIRRCSRMKWMTLPFTLPFLPDAWRISALNAIHRLRGSRDAKSAPQQEHPFTTSDVYIGPDAAPSVNLVLVATKSVR